MRTAVLVFFTLAASALAFVGNNNIDRDGNTVAFFTGADYASVERFPLSGPFTIEANVRVGSAALGDANGGTIFFSQRPGANTVSLAVKNTDTIEFAVEWACGTQLCSAQVTADVAWSAYQWHTLGAIFRPANELETETEVCLVVDDQLPALCSTAVSVAPTTFAAGEQLTTFIGTDGGADTFVGGIDDVRVWRVGFQDVEFDYGTINSADDRLLALWRFDEGYVNANSPFTVDDVAGNDAAINWAQNTLGGLFPPCNIPGTIARDVEPELRSVHALRTTTWETACTWSGDPHYYGTPVGNFDWQPVGWRTYAADTDGTFDWAVITLTWACGGFVSCHEKSAAINRAPNGNFVTVELVGSSLQVYTLGQAVFHAEGQLNTITGIVKNGNCYEAPGRWKYCGTWAGEIYVAGPWNGGCRQDCEVEPPANIFQLPVGTPPG